MKIRLAIGLFLAVVVVVTFGRAVSHGFVPSLVDPVPYRLWAGVSAAGFSALSLHVASLAVHTANAFLVFLCLLTLVGAPWPALVGALVFALHPMQTEAVAWVSALPALVAGFFSLFALWRFLEWRNGRGGPWGAVAALALGCGIAPGAVMMAGIFLALDFFHFGARRGKDARFYGAVGVLVAAVVVVTGLMVPASDAGSLAPWYLRPGIVADAYLFYLRKVLYPDLFLVDYARDPQSVLALRPRFGPAIVTTLVAFTFWKGSAPVRVAAAIFLLALLPTSGLVPFDAQRFSTVADRYAYLALLAPALVAALVAARGRVAATAVTALAIPLAVLSYRNVPHWKDVAGRGSLAAPKAKRAVAPPRREANAGELLRQERAL